MSTERRLVWWTPDQRSPIGGHIEVIDPQPCITWRDLRLLRRLGEWAVTLTHDDAGWNLYHNVGAIQELAERLGALCSPTDGSTELKELNAIKARILEYEMQKQEAARVDEMVKDPDYLR